MLENSYKVEHGFPLFTINMQFNVISYHRDVSQCNSSSSGEDLWRSLLQLPFAADCASTRSGQLFLSLSELKNKKPEWRSPTLLVTCPGVAPPLEEEVLLDLQSELPKVQPVDIAPCSIACLSQLKNRSPSGWKGQLEVFWSYPRAKFEFRSSCKILSCCSRPWCDVICHLCTAGLYSTVNSPITSRVFSERSVA